MAGPEPLDLPIRPRRLRHRSLCPLLDRVTLRRRDVARVALGGLLLLLAWGCAGTRPGPPAPPREATSSARALPPATLPTTRPVAGPSTKPDPLVIRVVGRQFDWSFEYPGGRVSDTLHLPAGRRLELRLTSPDVVHCLYIPALRVKCDAVPGLETKVQFSTSREGPFDVACSEFCGVRHSQHVTTGLVQSEQEFEQWLAGGAKR